MEELFEKMLNFMENQCADQNTTEKKNEIGVLSQMLQY